ncbi:mitochondrial fission ELM1 family protein [Lichenibacterium dinghuense]|uniref:mitochondrial fission ELM1 family protein n=1 Tax=Lichenibacterium dinghuense TaxID=2895977 RepID=UPI001F26F2A5|nr:mitochondrial fission ELM1 family protein [Lichenibacterium sp. 6Y81]
MVARDAVAGLLPPGTTAWVLSDGKIGDEVQCFGIADALGLAPPRRLIAPRAPWSWATPYGPVDPREAPGRPGSPIAPPYPDIVFAAGRRTVPYLRRVKRASGGRTFTVFVKDPYTGTGTADVIWIPEHDKLRGDNVVVSLTPAHRLRPEVFARARAAIDPRIAPLPQPRVAMVLGGKGVNHDFSPADVEALAGIAATIAGSGASLMVTPSRRTPPDALAAIRAALQPALAEGRAFVWDGTGENPYPQILAHASAILVTGDSANMVGEATATGAPVHVYEPSGGHPKVTRYLDRLTEEGAVRRWTGRLESWSYAPIDSAPVTAREIAARYRAFRGLTARP